MWDVVSESGQIANVNDITGGANVLYMDGHIEFLEHPNEKFPCVEWLTAESGK